MHPRSLLPAPGSPLPAFCFQSSINYTIHFIFTPPAILLFLTGSECNGTAVSWSPDGELLAVGFDHGGYLRVFHFDPVEGAFCGDLSCPVPPVSGYYKGINHMMWPENKALSFSYGVNSGTNTFSIVPFVKGGGKSNIIFDSPPAEGSMITADYLIPHIPKDEYHVLDVQVTIQYGEIVG